MIVPSPGSTDLPVAFDFAALLESLAQDDYAGLATLSDESLVTLLTRLHRNRAELLAFLSFLETFLAWYRTNPQHPGLERLAVMAPILRRDALALAT